MNISGFDTLDPHFAASFADRMLADMVFNGLIRFKPGLAPELEPDLALEIPEPVTLNGKQTWTFRLRDKVFFHGSPDRSSWELTAEDVVRSFEKTIDPVRSAYAGGYEGISIDALDPRTVRFTVDPPSPLCCFSPRWPIMQGDLWWPRWERQTTAGRGPWWAPDPFGSRD